MGCIYSGGGGGDVSSVRWCTSSMPGTAFPNNLVNNRKGRLGLPAGAPWVSRPPTRSPIAAWSLMVADRICESRSTLVPFDVAGTGKPSRQDPGIQSLTTLLSGQLPLSFGVLIRRSEMNRVQILIKGPCTVKSPHQSEAEALQRGRESQDSGRA